MQHFKLVNSFFDVTNRLQGTSFTYLNRLRSTKHRLLSTKRSMFSGLISIPFSKYDRAFSGSPHFNSCSACSISTLVSISSILSVRVSTFPRCFIIDPLRSPPPEFKSLRALSSRITENCMMKKISNFWRLRTDPPFHYICFI